MILKTEMNSISEKIIKVKHNNLLEIANSMTTREYLLDF